MAGLMKILASFREDALAPTLNCLPRNAHMDWDAMALEVVSEERSWKRNGEPQRRGSALSAHRGPMLT